jgi:hypothetical protein
MANGGIMRDGGLVVNDSTPRGSGMIALPQGKEVLGASAVPRNAMEQSALADLDVDKLNHLAECLFVLNGRRYGAIPGSYMVVCTRPGLEWCVGQLNADRAKPLILFEDMVFSSPDRALAQAERLKRENGGVSPRRSI